MQERTTRFWRYIYIWIIKEVFAGSFNWADRLASILGIGIPAVIWLIKWRITDVSSETEAAMNDWAWQAPAVIFGLLFVIRVVSASYRLHFVTESERNAAIQDQDDVTKGLTQRYHDGAQILSRRITVDEFDAWNSEYDLWRLQTQQYVLEHLGIVDEQLLLYVAWDERRSTYQVNEQHGSKLGSFRARLGYLRTLIERRR